MAYCEVLLNVQDCEHPPELEGGPRIRTRCFRCGAVACRSCSRIVRAIRICNDCLPHERVV